MSQHLAEVSHPLQGRYVFERELGHGGMATVYLALDLRLHREVAVKLLHPDLAATLGPERFLREIEIASRLTHPHILTLHDSGEAEGRLFFVMPYVEGESLRHWLEREPQLPVPVAVDIVRAVASALDYAHRAGVVHRDIKPENILLARDPAGGPPHPFVVDFGVARALDVAGGERLTQTGLALGTPGYMSPEQASAGRLDGRSDIYALGCVAYEMLAGAPPFTGPTAQAIMARHAVDPVPALRTVRAAVPESVAGAIEQALAKVPSDRFATAAEFAEALRAQRQRARRRWRLPSRRAAVILFGCGSALAAAAFGFWKLHNSSTLPVIPSAATIAVLPVAPASADTTLLRLGRDLAVTISASLDGVGGLETADRLTIASETAERQNLSSAEAAALAKRLGATSMVRGTLVRAGDIVRLDLGVYATDGLGPVAEGISVRAHRDSIGALTDSAALALLRQVWRRDDPPSPSLAAVTTRSLPALRAFLDGERELVAGRWGEAALAFRSAIAADSAFGLAHFRYALAKFWLEEPVEQEILDALKLHRSSLPEREQLLTDAFLTPGGKVALRVERYRYVTRRFPDYWPAWFLYADILAHDGSAHGVEWSEGLEAFQRLIALNPNLVPALRHMFFYTLRRRPDEASRALARLAELGWPPPELDGLRVQDQLLVGVSRAGGTIPPELGALADSFAEGTLTSEREYVAQVVGPLLLLSSGFPAAQLDLNSRALTIRKRPQDVVRLLRAANAWAWAARGRWDSALTTMSQAVSVNPGPIGGNLAPHFPAGRPVLAIENYGLAVLGVWLGGVAPALAEERRPGAVAAILQLERLKDQQDARARLAWLDGILAYAGRERSAIAVARSEVMQSGYYQANLVDRSLAAFDRALSGDRSRAGRELAELEEYCLNEHECNSFTPHGAVQRVAAVEWLREAGDIGRSRRLLQAWTAGAGVGTGAWWFTPYDAALSGPAYLARARLEESYGSPDLAREYYEFFLDVYDQPMPSHAPLVEEAKAALRRLQGEG